MTLTAKTIRKQLAILKPIMDGFSIKTTRRMQNKIGELMEWKYRRKIIHKKHTFENFEGAWVMPKDERRHGVILYLHGGGYTAGNLSYAKGFATVLAAKCGIKVFAVAYRLAPEHVFPAALEFIKNLRKESDNGLFPALRGCDWGEEFQYWIKTDVDNVGAGRAAKGANPLLCATKKRYN